MHQGKEPNEFSQATLWDLLPQLGAVCERVGQANLLGWYLHTANASSRKGALFVRTWKSLQTQWHRLLASYLTNTYFLLFLSE